MLKLIVCLWALMAVLDIRAAASRPDGVEATGPKRPLTVKDAIEMRHLVALDAPFTRGEKRYFEFSPGGDAFFILTRNSSVETGLIHYDLTLYRVADVLDYLNGADAAVRSRHLVRVSTQAKRGRLRQRAIRDAKWSVDGRSIFYIGDNGETPGQVYRIDLSDMRGVQVSHHPRTILSFEIDAENNTLIFLSTVENFDRDRERNSFVVGERHILGVAEINRENPFYFNYRFYQAPLSASAAKVIGEPRFTEDLPHYAAPRFWLSPDGRKVIALVPYKQPIPAAFFEDFEQPLNDAVQRIKGAVEFDEQGLAELPNWWALKFVLIDTATGHQQDIIENTVNAFTGTFFRVRWLPDSSGAVLAGSFLPTGPSAPEAWRSRYQQPAIVHVDVASGTVTRIADVPSYRSAEPGYAMDDLWLGQDHQVHVTLRARSGRDVTSYVYRKGADGWTVEPGRPHQGRDGRTLRLSVEQGLNTPPEIVATDDATGSRRTMTDLNPGFTGLTFGKAEPYDWVDAEGRAWRGGLVYPPGFVPGRRYPLVIQTHGFQPETFLIDGAAPWGPYAAQALANRDMVVLQLPDNYERGSVGRRMEVTIHRHGMEAAIADLSSRGVIDHHRVGIMGLSASCLYVDEMITFSDHPIAAAAITDGLMLSFGMFIRFHGLDAGMGQFEPYVDGGLPWGATLPTMLSRYSTFNLDRVKTPLRIERYLNGLRYVGEYWDTYALLKRLGKPVEFVVYPHANHQTINPLDRMASAGGNVD